MNEHKRQELAEVMEQAQRWDVGELVCGVAAASLLLMSAVLSEELSLRFGIGRDLLRTAFTILPLIWVGAMVYSRRAARSSGAWRAVKSADADSQVLAVLCRGLMGRLKR